MKKRVLILLILCSITLLTGCNQKAKNTGDMKDQQKRWVLENSHGIIDQTSLKTIEEELDKVDRLDSEYLILMPLENISNTNYIQVYNDTNVGNQKNEVEKFHVEVCFLKGNEDDFELRGKDHLTKEDVYTILKDYFMNHKIPDTKDWYVVS